MSFPEKTIAQTMALLKIQARAGVRKIPMAVAIVLNTSAEETAVRKWAIDYLTAKAEGRKFVDIEGEKDSEYWQEHAGKRGEDDPRSTH